MSSNPQIAIGVSAVDKASFVLDAVDQKVKESAETVEQAGSKMQEGADKTADAMTDSGTKTITKWQQVKDSFKANAQDILTSAAALGAGVVSFATSFSTLDQAQYRVDQSALALEKSQAKLEKMQRLGKATAEELARQQEDVAVKASYLALQQDNLSDAYTNFLAQIPNQMLAFGTATIGILQLMGVSLTQASIKAAIFGQSYTGALSSMNAHHLKQTPGLLGMLRSGVTALTGAMHQFRAASILAFLTNPIGIAIIGITTLVTLLVFNVGGLRDMFVNFGRTILDFLDNHFKPLADAIRTVVGWFGSLIGIMGQAGDANNAYGESMGANGYAIEATAKEIQTYEEWLQQVAEATAKADRENLYYLQSVEALTAGVGYSSDELQLATAHLQDVAREAAQTAEENFNLVATYTSLQVALDLTDEQVATLADTIRDYNERQEQATEAAEAEAEAHRKATDEIRDRVEANIELARSMGVHIDASKTTVGETERIRDHLERLKREYENSRERVEEFAIAHGTDIVRAVQASDDELLNIIDTLGGMTNKTAETRKSLVADFEASRQAIEDYAIATGTKAELASQYWSDAFDVMSDDVDKTHKKLQTLIDDYEDLARAKRRADDNDSDRRVTVGTGGSIGSVTTRSGRLAAIPNAQGGEGIVNEPTLFLAGEAGPEYYSFIPAGAKKSVPRFEDDEIKPRVKRNMVFSFRFKETNKEFARAEIHDIDALFARGQGVTIDLTNSKNGYRQPWQM